MSDVTERLERLEDELQATKAELKQVKEEKESILTPNRREFLKGGAVVGGTAAASGGILSSIFGTANAQDTGVAQIGEQGNPTDIVLDQIKDTGGDLVADLDDTGDMDWQGRGFDNIGSATIAGLKQVTTSQELTDAIGSVSAPSAVYIPSGVSITTGSHNIPDDTYILIDGEVTLQDNTDLGLFLNNDQSNGNQNIVIGSPSRTGVIDGNKANQDPDANPREAQGIISLIEVAESHIYGLELKNCLREITVNGQQSNNLNLNYRLHDLYIHDMGTASANSDAVHAEGENGLIGPGIVIENWTDTAVAVSESLNVRVNGVVAREGNLDSIRGYAAARNAEDISFSNIGLVGSGSGSVGFEAGSFSGSTPPSGVSLSNFTFRNIEEAVVINEINSGTITGPGYISGLGTATPLVSILDGPIAVNPEDIQINNAVDGYRYSYGAVSDPTSTFNGYYISPPTYDLNGGASTTSLTRGQSNHHELFVKSSGSAGTLQGIDNLRAGATVTIYKYDPNDVTLAHNDINATYSFLNDGSTDLTLTTNGENATYKLRGPGAADLNWQMVSHMTR